MLQALQKVWQAVKAPLPFDSVVYNQIYFGVLDDFSETTFIPDWTKLPASYQPSFDQPLLVLISDVPVTSVKLPRLESGKNCLRIENVILLMTRERDLMFCEAFTSLGFVNHLNFLPEFTSQLSGIHAQYNPEFLGTVAEQLPQYFGSHYILNRYFNSAYNTMYSMQSYEEESVPLTKSRVSSVMQDFSTIVFDTKLPQSSEFGNDLTFYHLSSPKVLAAKVSDNLYGHLVGIKLAQHCQMRMTGNIDLVKRIIVFDHHATPLSAMPREFLSANLDKIISQIKEQVKDLHENYAMSHGQICMNRIVHSATDDRFYLLPSACMNSPDYYLQQYMPYDTDVNTTFKYDEFCIGALQFELHFGFTIIDPRLLPNNLPKNVEAKSDMSFLEVISYLVNKSTHRHRMMAVYMYLKKIIPPVMISLTIEDKIVNVNFTAAERDRPYENEYTNYIDNQIGESLNIDFEFDYEEELRYGKNNFWYTAEINSVPEEGKAIFKEVYPRQYQSSSCFFALLSKFELEFNARTYRYLGTLIEILWGMYMPEKYFDKVKTLQTGIYKYEADFLRIYSEELKDVEVIPESQLDRMLFGLFTERLLSREGIYYIH